MLWSDILSSHDFKIKLEKLLPNELNDLDSEGYSLLSYSLMNKDAAFVEYLLKDLNVDPKVRPYHGITVNVGEVQEKYSPLWRAAIRAGEPDKKLKLLRNHGANLNECDDLGFSLLSYILYTCSGNDVLLLEFILRDLGLVLKQHAFSCAI